MLLIAEQLSAGPCEPRTFSLCSHFRIFGPRSGLACLHFDRSNNRFDRKQTESAIDSCDRKPPVVHDHVHLS